MTDLTPIEEEVVENNEHIVVSATPKDGLDWYIKWISSILILVSMAFRASEGDYKLFDMAFGFVGILGWTVVSVMWRDRALIMLNVVSLMMLAVGILNNV